jgi:hypothetical protein
MRFRVSLLGLVLVAACGGERAPQRLRALRLNVARPQVSIVDEAAPRFLANGRGDGQGNGSGDGQGRGERKGECPVTIDGRVVGALRYSELPPSMPTTMHALDDGRRVQRFVLADYVRALGVPTARVQAVHLHGGRGRVTILSGNELRRVGQRLQIHFTQETAGRPTFKYPGVDLRANTAIDGIRAVAIYVDAAPPVYKNGQLYVGDTVVDGGVEDASLAIRATRIYLDGKYAGALRRRELQNGKSLPQVLARLGIDAATVNSADIVSADAVRERVTAAKLGTLTATAGRGGHGRFTIAGVAAGEPIEAVLLYAHAKPSARNVVRSGGES